VTQLIVDGKHKTEKNPMLVGDLKPDKLSLLHLWLCPESKEVRENDTVAVLWGNYDATHNLQGARCRTNSLDRSLCVRTREARKNNRRILNKMVGGNLSARAGRLSVEA